MTLNRSEWTDLGGLYVARAAPFGLSSIREQVRAGVAVLYMLKHGDDTVGAVVLRVDQCANGESEGVIVAAVADVAGVDMIAACLGGIEKLFVNCARVRYHTASPMVARRMAREGYRAREIVSVKELKK